jgi:membrane protein
MRFTWRLLSGTGSKFIKDHASFLAAGLAFNLLLYSVPFLLLVISVLAFTLGSSGRALLNVQESAKQLLPDASEAVVNTLSRIIDKRNLLGLVAVPLFLVLSSVLFGAIRLVLNVVFQAAENPSYIKQKISDLILILVVTCLVILSVGVGSLLAILQALGEGLPVIGDFLKPGWIVATHALVFFFTATLFYTLYRFSPDETISPRALVVAALTGATMFSLSKWAFSWYVALAKANTLIYGALAAIVFYNLWLFYASIVFIIGAEVGWAFDREGRRRRKHAA